MSYETLTSYATSAVAEILPLDQETCSEMISYALSLPTDSDIESHFLNLLGEDEATFNFITNFMKLKQQADSQKLASANDKKSSAQKFSSKADETIFSNSPKSINSSKASKEKNAWQSGGPEMKKDAKPVKGRLEKSKTATTSELLDLKPSNQQSNQQAKKSKKKNLDNLKDIESALNELEVTSQELDLDSSNHIKRVCNCMATRHPLFEVSPNCLNCGKIICSKEGLQPCSFCGQDLLSFKDKQEIINILRAERDNLEFKQENIKNKSIQEQDSNTTGRVKGKKIKISMNAGENLWQAQDKALKKADAEKKRLQELIDQKEEEQKKIDEQKREFQVYERTKDVNPELLKAQERLETLLDFQATGAERTKIIDRASDYEMPSSNSGSAWLSPAERALRLKRQQKSLRKYEDDVRSRGGRSKRVVEMVIKDGKVHMVEKIINTADNEDVDKELEDLEDKVKESKLQNEVALSKNTWDYEKETNKWEKPVYVPSSSRKHSSSDAMNIKDKARVQLFGTDDESELVVAMPS